MSGRFGVAGGAVDLFHFWNDSSIGPLRKAAEMGCANSAEAEEAEQVPDTEVIQVASPSSPPRDASPRKYVADPERHGSPGRGHCGGPKRGDLSVCTAAAVPLGDSPPDGAIIGVDDDDGFEDHPFAVAGTPREEAQIAAVHEKRRSLPDRKCALTKHGVDDMSHYQMVTGNHPVETADIKVLMRPLPE